MESDRMRILKMLREGRITPEQANDLLIALESPGSAQSAARPAASQPPEGPPPPQGQRAPERAGRDWASLGRDIAARVVEGLPQSLGDLSSASRRHNFSKMRLTQSKLSRFEDGTKYVNFGRLTIADDVSEDLLAAKIADYINFGITIGPTNLVNALEDLCLNNFGRFIASEDAEADEGEAEAAAEDGGAPGVGVNWTAREARREARAAAREAKHEAKAAAREARREAREAMREARRAMRDQDRD